MEPNQPNSPGSAARAPSSVDRVLKYALDNGFTPDIAEYPAGTKTAQDAASAVGCEVAQIVKSMVFDADGEIVLALTSGINQVAPDALAKMAGASRCGRANADQVRATTGFAIGGVAPFGHARPVRCWIDPHLLNFDQVWAAAGTPRHVFRIDPKLLLELTGAEVADFTAHDG